jgi:hypothetical protein
MQDNKSLYPPNFRHALIPLKDRMRKNRRTVTMPTVNVSPAVRLVFSEMARLRITYDALEFRSGIRRATYKAWRRKTNRPSLESLTAALNSLGWDFTPTPSLEALPATIAGELVALAKRIDRDIPATWAALIDTGVEQRLLRMRAEERATVLAEHDARRLNTANDNAKPNATTTAA